ncbi:unannotated protein [freshwater metagenome]|uniref:Unannotated protein n=1 Tax=freshwater metagenome TaxID=449393 RepID=A0A6J6G4F7_9ZZZZ
MSVHGDRTAGLSLDRLGHGRHAGAAPHEQDPADAVHRQSGAADRTVEGLDGLLQPWPDHVLELTTREPHTGLDARERDGDDGVGVARQALLRVAAVDPESGDGGPHRRVIGVERAHRTVEHLVDVGEDRGVDVDATESFHALRTSDQRESGVGALHQCDVEGATTEVVHRHDASGLDTVPGRVRDGGCLRLREELHPSQVEARVSRHLAHHVELVRAVVRRMRDDDLLRCLTLSLDHEPDDTAEEVPHQRFGAVGGTSQDQRYRVAEPSLELPRHPRRLVDPTADGRFTDEHVAVISQEHDRRDHRAGRPQ